MATKTSPTKSKSVSKSTKSSSNGLLKAKQGVNIWIVAAVVAFVAVGGITYRVFSHASVPPSSGSWKFVGTSKVGGYGSNTTTNDYACQIYLGYTDYEVYLKSVIVSSPYTTGTVAATLYGGASGPVYGGKIAPLKGRYSIAKYGAAFANSTFSARLTGYGAISYVQPGVSSTVPAASTLPSCP